MIENPAPSYVAAWVPPRTRERGADVEAALVDRWVKGHRRQGPTVFVVPRKQDLRRSAYEPMAKAGEVVAGRDGWSSHGERTVVALWPTFETLAKAEDIAGEDGALCVVAWGDLDEVLGWLTRTRATALAPLEVPPLRVAGEVAGIIDRMIERSGHNNFSGVDKEFSVRDLRRVRTLDPELAAKDLRQFMQYRRQRPSLIDDLAELYEAVSSGRRLLDYRRRPI